MIKIKQVYNGYVVSRQCEYIDSGETYWTEHVFQGEDADGLDSLKKTFEFLMEVFEVYNSKHDDKHLIVKIKKNKEKNNF